VLPTGTVTFLFTDIEGSTRLWEAHPDIMRLTLVRHDRLMRAAIDRHNGCVFKTVGDAFCATFAEGLQAVCAIISAQQAMLSEPWPEETPISVRMALHTGSVERRDADYFGPPVNRVARLLAAAHGGQSILSQATCELVRNALPDGVTLRDLGSTN
jgi:class 3 adenylate cyclase